MTPKPRFTDGEKVLCFHGPLLYEAKCLRSQLKDKHVKYFIHYSGWNKNWDEWVPECRVLKYNEANLLKQKELQKTHIKSRKSKPAKLSLKKEGNEKDVAPSSPVPSPSAEKLPKPKLEKRPPPATPSEPSTSSSTTTTALVVEPAETPDATIDDKEDDDVIVEQEEEEEPENEIKIHIPEILQTFLVDDHDFINRQQKLLHLPAKTTIDHVIANFVRDKVEEGSLSETMEDDVIKVANKIRDVFNVFLGNMLLYRFERPQYADVLADLKDTNLSAIYGAAHLLRLLTKIGSLLTPLPDVYEAVMPELVDHLEEIVRYMSANELFFVQEEYIIASPEYHRRAL